MFSNVKLSNSQLNVVCNWIWKPDANWTGVNFLTAYFIGLLGRWEINSHQNMSLKRLYYMKSTVFHAQHWDSPKYILSSCHLDLRFDLIRILLFTVYFRHKNIIISMEFITFVLFIVFLKFMTFSRQILYEKKLTIWL